MNIDLNFDFSIDFSDFLDLHLDDFFFILTRLVHIRYTVANIRMAANNIFSTFEELTST